MSAEVGQARPRPRRSVLYMPAANERALAKARGLAADALILDLEDAVAPAAKPEARERAVHAASSGGYGQREVTIRCNAIGTPWHDEDVAAIAASGADAVVVPKVDGPDDVERVAGALGAAGAPADLAIWPMVETPAAVTAVSAIAAHQRVTVLVMGTNDLVTELRAEFVPGRAPLLHALSACVLGARRAGKAVLDGVFNDLSDADGFAAECLQGRQLGMDGKTVVHPRQLEAANATWSPTADEVDHARELIAAFEQAGAEGRGVVVVDGRMVENLHVEQAHRTVALAEAIAALADEQA